MTDEVTEHVAAIIYNCNHAHDDWERMKQVGKEVDLKHPNTDLQREYRNIMERNRRAAQEIIDLVKRGSPG